MWQDQVTCNVPPLGRDADFSSRQELLSGRQPSSRFGPQAQRPLAAVNHSLCSGLQK